MKISKEDYDTLITIAEFHFKFSEYVRETNEELFYRAVDYGKTFSKVDGVTLQYWHEDNKKFLEELYSTLRKREMNFNNLVNKLGNEEQATEAWMEKKKTNKEDPLGMKNYLSNFVRHARELDYDSFDMNDWEHFVKITKYIKNDPKFIEFAIQQIERVLGETSDFLKEFKNEN